jgi:hypothetical protein
MNDAVRTVRQSARRLAHTSNLFEEHTHGGVAPHASRV